MKKLFSILMVIMMLLSSLPASVLAEEGIYTITYHLDGGTNALKNPDAYTFEDTIVLQGATKTGYSFEGWYLDEAKTVEISEISNRTGDIDLYAKFSANTYTATFDGNGATQSAPLTVTLETVQTITVNNGDEIDPYAIATPTKSGYVFLGWYHGDQLISGSIKITSDLTLTPKWERCWTTNYDGDGDKMLFVLGETAETISGWVTSKSINAGSDLEVQVEDKRYSFYDAVGTNQSWDIYIYVSGKHRTIRYEADVRYFHWEKTNQYGAVVSSDDSYTSFGIYDVTNDTSLVDISGFTDKRDKSISGYLTLAPGTLLRISNSVSHSIWGHYSAGSGWSITSGSKRKAPIAVDDKRTQEIAFDSAITPPDTSKTGYDFLGWYDEQDNRMTETWQYAEDKTFTAKWQLKSHTIDYHLDGGVNSPSNPSTYTIEDSITLEPPYKAGYTFVGWYSDPAFTTKVTTISQQSENIALYAKYTANSYPLSLEGNGGAFAPLVTFVSDEKIVKSVYLFADDSLTAYRPEHKEGYVFAGWHTDESLTTLYNFTGIIEDDLTLYAKWIACDHKSICVETMEDLDVYVQGKPEQLYAFVPLADGEITITSVSDHLDLYGSLYDAGKNVLVSNDDISDMDLDFSFSYRVKAGALYYLAVKGNTALTEGAAVIRGAWSGHCTVTGTTYPNRQVSVVFDTPYSLPQKAVRKGYVFLGWYDENGQKVTDGIWQYDTEKTLTAQWETASCHTVVFKDVEGNVIAEDAYYFGEDIVAPELPTKEPDEYYRYTVTWDDSYTGVCTGDAVYTMILVAEHYHFDHVTVTEPTCTEKGYTTHTCLTCGESYIVDEVDALGHTYESEVTTPDCTNGGCITYTCSVCGDSYVSDEVDALGHTYTSAVTTAPTCADAGIMTYTCSVCGDTYTEAIPATGKHTYEAVVTAPTCVDEGYTTYTCSVCGDSYVSDEVDALGHTCDDTGHCIRCSFVAGAKMRSTFYATLSEALEAAANSEFYYPTVYALRDFDGDFSIPSMVDFDGSSYIFNGAVTNDGRISGGTFNGAVTNDGRIYNGTFNNAVTNDGSIYDGTFNGAVTNDGRISDGTFNGAVTNDGSISGGTFHDAVTNDKYISSGTFNDAVTNNYFIHGGTFNNTVINNDRISGGTFNNTVTNNANVHGGTFNAVLVNGGTVLSSDIIPFSFGEHFIFDNYGEVWCSYHYQKNAPTCEASAVCQLGCSYGDPLGHTYTTVTSAPTCGATGVVTHTCSGCGDVYTETIPATGEHIYTSMTTQAPTCVAAGVMTYTCSVCKDSYTGSIAPTGKHTYEHPCSAACSVCGGENPAPAEHSYSHVYDTDCDLCGAVREITMIFGDTTGDGKVNVRDIGVMQQYLNGWDVELNPAAADVTGDGKVNVRDLGRLQQYLNGWDVQLGTP